MRVRRTDAIALLKMKFDSSERRYALQRKSRRGILKFIETIRDRFNYQAILN
jgi:hypothetical protein